MVRTASDPYNHHAKPLMSKSTALTRTLVRYVRCTCARMRHTSSEDLLTISLDHSFLLSPPWKLLPADSTYNHMRRTRSSSSARNISRW